jgi:hypothetical protein
MTARFNKSPKARSTIECRFDNAIAVAMELRQVVLAEILSPDGFRSLELAMEAIPIAAEEYAWLSTRLRNAKGYLDQQECCAGAYELT